ncbi:MAG: ABC transporter ATP-binding protein [Nitrososphaerota archaeon]|nr:ABC transporter ATP-binding protein [Candidatus Bathyarchaeota archaeon]MDW8048232.1 ABC transporter ATP-binding protein [Nitrososphaerota archaeon]
MSKIIVRTIGLSKTYRRGLITIKALNNVDLQIAEGEIACIMGPSGSGKTTLLNLIGGLDKPTHGKVFVDGTDITSLNDRALANYRLRKVGFIFQFYNLIPTLTALENVEVPLAFAKVPKDERKARALNLLRTVGLEDRADHKPDELSGGEQQRVAIARALANNPTLILADEPTGDLDSKSAVSFMKIVKELNAKEGRTFIIVTHDPLVVEQCSRLFTIRDGQIESIH